MSSNNQGAVLHPESDRRLKENQDGEPYQRDAGRQSNKNYDGDSQDRDISKSGETHRSNGQGAVLHPETDRRLKENRDGWNSDSDNSGYDRKETSNQQSGGKIDQIINNEDFNLINSHENAKGDQTLVFENEKTGAKKVFPNVDIERHEGLSDQIEQAQ